MIGPRGLGKGGEYVASSCSEGGVRARAPPTNQSSREFSPHRARTSVLRPALFLLHLPLPRVILCHLFRRTCARAARVRVSPGLRRRRARAPPGLDASVAGLRHCAPDSAQCRLAPAPAPAPTCAPSAACSARTDHLVAPPLRWCGASGVRQRLVGRVLAYRAVPAPHSMAA